MDQIPTLIAGTVLITLIICAAYVVTRSRETKDEQRETKDEQPTPRRYIDATTASLIVLVCDNDKSVTINVYGTNMQDIAFAAAHLTMIAAKNCSDGFEKGLEHIQQDAMDLAARKDGY